MQFSGVLLVSGGYYVLKKIWLAALISFCGATTAATAATVTVGTDEGLVRPGMDNQGYWRSYIPNGNLTNDNYIASSFYGTRPYFTFDLSGLVGQKISGLTLNLRRYIHEENPIITFWDVSTSAADLAQRGVADWAIFNDLGSGKSYGNSGPISYGASTDVLSFVLNNEAIADANKAIGGYFSIGLSVTGGTIFAASGEEPGNRGPGYTQDLVIVVSPMTVIPLPATLPLLASGLGIFGFAVWSRKRTA